MVGTDAFVLWVRVTMHAVQVFADWTVLLNVGVGCHVMGVWSDMILQSACTV